MELRKEGKEDYGKVGGSKEGIGYRLVYKIMCSLEDGYASEGPEKEAFQRRVHLDAQKQWRRLAEGRGKSFTKAVMGPGHDCHQGLPSAEFMIGSPCEVTFRFIVAPFFFFLVHKGNISHRLWI